MKFTEEIARYIHSNEIDLDSLTIVIPSKRAQLYISSALFKEYGKPIFAPQMLTIDEWVKKNTPFNVIDKTSLLFQLYKIHVKIEVDKEKLSFDEFQKWGSLLLKDFDEIDRYLLNYKDAFKNLNEIHRIEEDFLSSWAVEEQELSQTQQKFLKFWKTLPDYYTQFQELLIQQKINYSGKAYRYVSEHINSILEKEANQVLFAGFNALSKSESEIIKAVHRHAKGHILIDADKYYIEDQNHEAGSFIRQLMKNLQVSELPIIKDRLKNKELKIDLIECPQVTGQVKVASSILSTLSQKELDKTVLLLADESLIVPMIQNIPKSVKTANITLGLPLKNSPIKSWVELIFNIQENKKRFSQKGLYFKDFQMFCNHPFIQAGLNKNDRDLLIKTEETAIKFNQIVRPIKSLDFCEHLYKIIKIISKDWKLDWIFGIETIRELNETCFAHLQEENVFEKAILNSFDQAIVELQNISSKDFPEMKFNTFRSLFKSHTFQQKISYHGNPIDGLQIMGLLETRMIDFENIIIVGMNEGVIPNTNPLETYFPMDLRRYLGLPLPRQKQGLFAYHFYRLLHYSKNVYCTYTSVSEGIGKAEASRYLLQLDLELQNANKNISLNKQKYLIPASIVNEKEKAIIKDEEYFFRLDEFFKRPLSASAINKFITCPKDFYNRYILEFEEEDTIEEEVESSTFGTFIHDVLEELYTPFALFDKDGKQKKSKPHQLSPQDMDLMISKYEKLMFEFFEKHFKGNKDAFASGKNLLSYKMALELTKRILLREKKLIEDNNYSLSINQLEADLSTTIDLNINETKKTIKLYGRIDRIDTLDNQLRVIDYKSGKVEAKDVSFSKKDNQSLIEAFSKCKHAAQLMMYCVLYKNNNGKLPDLTGIYSVINQDNDLSNLKSSKLQLDEMVSMFPDFITEIIETLYDPNIPIEHNHDAKYCAFC